MHLSRGFLVWSVVATAQHVLLFGGELFAIDVRIKDIANVEGVRLNKLTGMGLVTGLNGTGGRSPITREFAQNMSLNLGQRADPLQRTITRNDAKQRTDNVSVVTVIADLTPFARIGTSLDVTVSAFDDATWPQAFEFTDEEVSTPRGLPAYFRYLDLFEGARWIWTNNLVLDNLVIARHTVE